jgi:tetracycline resistance efflux pump
LPAMAAVLAGSVLGDHCSPISDTTILSSTGAGSNHIDHVLTQLPYALIGAIAASIGYLVLGFTGSTLLGLGVVIILILAFAFLFGEKAKPAVSEQ